MAAIELENHQIVYIGEYPAPDVEGYNSLFFHPLTRKTERKEREEFGLMLTGICESLELPYYYFYNDLNTKINVYPNFLIQEHWQKFCDEKGI